DPGEIIKLASNENPLGPSPRAVAAMEQAVRGVHLYPDGSSYQLRRRLAAELQVDPAQVVLGNGSNEVLELVGHAFLEPGAEVVVSEYCFAVYPIVTALFGARLVSVPATPGLAPYVRAMAAAITPRTRVLFLANPNNPTGTLTSREDIEWLLGAVPGHVLVVMDEAYVEFLDEPVDCLSRVRSGARSNLLITRTFSKIHGLAGLRVGYGVGPVEVVAALEKTRQPFHLNSIAQAGALAALDDRLHLEQTRANNRAGLAGYHQAFRELGLPHVPSAGNFVLVRVGDGAGVFSALQRRGVITRPTASYRLPEWLRISVGTPAENARCLAALREVLGR
ncbi:MAG: histidinol-phosphate transaminase, partial [Verrucomicrobiota bacterium]